jgi:N-acetylmuramoyl-L-alanine amidase
LESITEVCGTKRKENDLRSLLVYLTGVLIVCIVASFYYVAKNISEKPLIAEFDDLTPQAKRQIECLADNIYFESAHEPAEGKIAVAFVTMNRVYSSLWPNNICDVVLEKGRNPVTGKIVCQFSWYCEERPKAMRESRYLTKTNNQLYNEIRDLAVQFYLNYENMEDPSRGAVFYHADYVSPGWRNVTKTTVIGRHIFYVRKETRT